MKWQNSPKADNLLSTEKGDAGAQKLIEMQRNPKNLADENQIEDMSISFYLKLDQFN